MTLLVEENNDEVLSETVIIVDRDDTTVPVTVTEDETEGTIVPLRLPEQLGDGLSLGGEVALLLSVDVPGGLSLLDALMIIDSLGEVLLDDLTVLLRVREPVNLVLLLSVTDDVTLCDSVWEALSVADVAAVEETLARRVAVVISDVLCEGLSLTVSVSVGEGVNEHVDEGVSLTVSVDVELRDNEVVMLELLDVLTVLVKLLLLLMLSLVENDVEALELHQVVSLFEADADGEGDTEFVAEGFSTAVTVGEPDSDALTERIGLRVPDLEAVPVTIRLRVGVFWECV